MKHFYTAPMPLPRQRRERDPLWRREMRERWRRPVTLFFMAIYAASLSWLAYSLYASLVPQGVDGGMNQARGVGHRLFSSLLGAQIVGWIPIALLLAAPTIAVERERNAFTEYLLAGLLPSQIARAKFASIGTFIIVMCAVPLPVLALCFPLGGVEPLELLAGGLLEMAVALFCAAVGLLISAGHARVTNAMQHGLVVALLLMGIGTPFLLGVLNSPAWTWLGIAAFLALMVSVLFRGCEEMLNDIARHLEQHERALQPQRLPSPPVTPKPQPAPSVMPRTTPVRRDSSQLSAFDVRLEEIAAWNAVTQREVRVGTRASRVRMSTTSEEHLEPFPFRFWFALGLCGAALVWSLGFATWWRFGIGLAATGAIGAAGLSSSAAFTREREQKMLGQLRLCSLSPLELVMGKIAATFLLVARSFGGPLVALWVVGFSQGALVGVGSALLVVGCIALAATLGTTLSLLCRHTSIASGGTLGALIVAFGLLPFAPVGLAFFVPSLRPIVNSFVLGTLWIEPLRTVWGVSDRSLSLGHALWILTGVVVALNALLLLAATGLLARARLDEGETVRFWERDLSRSWR